MLGVPPEGRLAALRALSDRLLPGRWDEVRQPTPKELAATLVLEMPLEHASVKVRTGPPSPFDASADPPPDGVPLWWGVVPLRVTPGRAVTAPGRPGRHTAAAVRARPARPTSAVIMHLGPIMA